jgi:hypothetical protein
MILGYFRFRKVKEQVETHPYRALKTDCIETLKG